MTTSNLADRDLRQREIVPPERLAACRATVVGVGAIGRQVALQLATMGVPWLQLVDPDIVEPVNLACRHPSLEGFSGPTPGQVVTVRAGQRPAPGTLDRKKLFQCRSKV